MPIDVHAHYVPTAILDTLERESSRYGVKLVAPPPACQRCLRFDYGLQIRPFFPGLVQAPEARIEAMAKIGIERQVLSLWCDIFAHRLPAEQGEAWHRLMNESLAAVCERHPAHFSWLASGALPDAARAARELERAVKQGGAVGAVMATNIDGVNPGDLALDEFWAAATELDVPVFLHPAQPVPPPRTEKFALNQIAQYTFDTTLAIGSIIGAGVLDRFPRLRVLLSHGGGTLPYLAGRFDVMYQRMDRDHQHCVAGRLPSDYLGCLWYDTILHDGVALRYLAERVGIARLVLGSDDPFPPMDRDPLATLRAAGFGAADVTRIATLNPRTLFPRLP